MEDQNCTQPEFVGFPKIARLSRDMIVTEKIDGTNAQVLITESGEIFAGSRSRWITPQQDNYSFAKWVELNREEILTLGPGRHYGEWWGRGIQRGYNVPDKRWSLFNVTRWCLYGQTPQPIPSLDPNVVKMQDVLPPCVGLVPVIYKGPFNLVQVAINLDELSRDGSKASPGFMDPEGLVVYHTAANICFKKTIKKDELPKTLAA